MTFRQSIALTLSLAALGITAACGGKKAMAGEPVSTSVEEAWQAYDAFNAVYLDTTKYIYRNTNRDSAAVDRWNGAAAIWCQPMYVDMAMNASQLAQDAGDSERAGAYRRLARNLIEGNIKHYAGFDFDDGNTTTGWFIYDDIQWWTITLARAARFFDDDRYRKLAAASFARVWYGSPRVGDTGSYADPAKELGGGMFWQWQPLENPDPNKQGDGKMSCINFPTVVAAMLLHEITPADAGADPEPEVWTNAAGTFTRPHFETRQRYLEMADEVFDWSVKNLTDSVTGMVHDHRHGDSASGHPLLYNQATFIGAATLLHRATGNERYLDLARRGADYSIDSLSAPNGYLPWARDGRNPYSQGSLEQGIYPAIWAQYMKLLIDDCADPGYTAAIARNIAEGWKNRDPKSKICDACADTPTPADTLIGSYAASTTPSLMLLFTPVTSENSK